MILVHNADFRLNFRMVYGSLSRCTLCFLKFIYYCLTLAMLSRVINICYEFCVFNFENEWK